MWLFISRVASPIHNSTQFKPLKLDGVFQTEIYHFYLRFSVKVTWPFLIQMQRRKLSEFYTLQEFSHLNSNKRMELKAPMNLSTVSLKSYKHVFKRILIKNERLLMAIVHIILILFYNFLLKIRPPLKIRVQLKFNRIHNLRQMLKVLFSK